MCCYIGTLVKGTISQIDFSERKSFSNSLARSVTESNNLLCVLFSVNVLFLLNEIHMLLFSQLFLCFVHI